MAELKSHVFYCYDYNMANWLRNKGIDYYTIGKHRRTNKVFTLFLRGKKLDQAIEEYNSVHK